MLMSQPPGKKRFAAVIKHVHHEGLGLIEPAFVDAAVDYKYFAPGDPGLDEAAFDMLVVMGGPASLYDKYPWLERETGVIKKAVEKEAPVLGVCLGAQLIAAALGAEVMPCGGKEIGWYEVEPTPAGMADPLLSRLGAGQTVFQWHGDTFALPAGAELLASSSLCPHQAFRFGRNVYALQFHLEVTAPMISEWLSVPANREEVLALAGGPGLAEIESGTVRHAASLEHLGKKVFAEFLSLP